MPNWTNTTIYTHKGVLNKYLDGKNFDFNLLFPMPKDLEIESSSVANEALIMASQHDQSEKVRKLAAKTYFECNYFHDLGEETIKANEERWAQMTQEEKNESIRLAERYMNNCQKYGCPTWQ